MSFTSDNMAKSSVSIVDMMFQMQRMGLRALSIYQPVAASFLDIAKAGERAARSSGFNTAQVRSTEARETSTGSAEQVVAIGEEVLTVGTRTVPGKTTRVRRVVVETPVQQDVTLHTETVVVEHRRPISSIGQDVLTEVTYEMSDSNEIPVVSKTVHLVEEVLLRKEVTARVETIHDTVKRDTVEIDNQNQLPVVYNAAEKMEERKREEKRAADLQRKKQTIVPMQSEAKPDDQKRQPN
jgi:stress response protein YsnF